MHPAVRDGNQLRRSGIFEEMNRPKPPQAPSGRHVFDDAAPTELERSLDSETTKMPPRRGWTKAPRLISTAAYPERLPQQRARLRASVTSEIQFALATEADDA